MKARKKFKRSAGKPVASSMNHPQKVKNNSNDKKKNKWDLNNGDGLLQEIIDQSKVVIYLKDTKSRHLFINRHFEKLFHVKKEEVLGKTNHDLFPKKVADSFRKNDLKVLKTKTPMQFEETAPQRDGEHTYISLKFPLLNKQGNPYAICGISTDITDLKQKEKEGSKREKLLKIQNRVLLELTTHQSLFKGDLNGAVRKITEISAQTLNVNRVGVWLYNDDRSLMNCVDLFELDKNSHSVAADLSNSDYPKYFNSLKKNRIIDAHLAHSDPRTRELSKSYLKPLNISSLLDLPIRLKGKMVGIICHEHIGRPREWTLEEQQFAASLADFISLEMEIQERIKIENELHKSEEQIGLLLESSGEGIYGIDLNGNCTFANPACLEILGFDDMNDLIGKNMHTLIHHTREDGKPYPDRECQIYKAFRKKQGTHIEGEVFWRANGTPFPVEYRSYPIIRNKKSVGAVVTFSDITERKKVEEALRESQELFHTLAKVSPVGIFQTDVQGDCVYVNEKWCQITGLTKEKALGKGWARALHPDDRERVFEEWYKSTKKKKPFRSEYRFLNRNGVTTWVFGQAKAIKEKRKTISGYVGTITDITGLKKVEEKIIDLNKELEIKVLDRTKELEESQRALTTLLGNLPGMAYRCLNDRDWTMEFVSEGSLELTGYSPSDLINKNVVVSAGLIHPNDRNRVWEEVQAALKENRSYQLIFRIRTASGQEKWVWEQGRQVEISETGEPLLEGFITDISGQKKAEEALQDSEKRLRGIMDNSPIAIYMKDTQGRYLFVNKQFQKAVQMNHRQIVGRTDFEIFPKEIAEEFRENDRKVLESRKPLEFEESTHLEDGLHFFASVKFPFLDSDGNPYAVCGISLDITTRKQMELEVIQEAQQKNILARLGELAWKTDNLQIIFDHATQWIAQVLGVEYSKILLLNDSKTSLCLVSGVGWRKGLVGNAQVGIDRDSQAGFTLLKKKCIVVKNLNEETRFSGPPLLRSHGVVSGISAPIIAGKRNLGVIGAHSKSSIEFSESKIDFLESVAHILAGIIHRKQAEDSYRDLYENAPVGYFSSASNRIIQDMNNYLLEMLGYQRDEIAGKKTLKNLITKEFYNDFEINRGKLERREVDGFRGLEFNMVHKNGSIIPVKMDVSIDRDTKGNIIRTRAVVTDITELKRFKDTQEIMLRYERGLSSFTATLLSEKLSEDPVSDALKHILKAARAHRVCVYEFIQDPNEGDCIRLNYEVCSEGISGGLDDPFLKKIPHLKTLQMWKDRFSKGEVISGLIKDFPEPDKTILKNRNVVSILELPIMVSGKFDGIIFLHDCQNPRVWIKDDITLLKTAADVLGNFFEKRIERKERIKLREQFIQSEKLSTIGTFISSIAHELNNPLTSILGYSELISDLSSMDKEELKEDLAVIQKESRRSAEIVKNLLNFTRKHKPTKEVFWINDIIHNIVDLKAYQLKLENIKVRTEFKLDLPSFFGNANQLQQVILNLIINAEQKLKDEVGKGIITIRTKHDENWIFIEVEDDGPPIPEEIFPEIFNSFFTTKEPGMGTGLGLSVCYGIIAENGGCIHAENLLLEKGVKFTIELPLKSKDVIKPVQEVQPLELVDGSGLIVLIVDDEEPIVDLLRKILHEKKFIVETATSGIKALKIIKRKKIDLVISDVRMPDMDGIELAKKILKVKPQLVNRFIFISGSITSHLEDFADQVQLQFIQKPFEKKQVLEKIQNVLNSLQPQSD